MRERERGAGPPGHGLSAMALEPHSRAAGPAKRGVLVTLVQGVATLVRWVATLVRWVATVVQGVALLVARQSGAARVATARRCAGQAGQWVAGDQAAPWATGDQAGPWATGDQAGQWATG